MKRIKCLLCASNLFFSVSLSAQISTLVQPHAVSNGQTFGFTTSPDGNTAYFVYSMGGREHLQILQSERDKEKWSAPKPAFFGRKGVREIDPFISLDGNTILYNTRRSIGGSSEKDLDVWMLQKQNGKWGLPFPVDAINTAQHETYATLSSRGNIYFGVDRAGGYGGGDIYVSKYEKGKYLAPTNVGFPVNTDKEEGNCFIAPDESYMIFSANGHASNFGGFDLYFSVNQSGKWSIPINLGDKINSTENDFCPVVAKGDTLYFSRSRKEGENLIENIYFTTLNIPLLKAMAGMQSKTVLENAFPDGDVYGITFSPDGKTAFTTLSNETRAVCEIYSLLANSDGTFTNPQKMLDWAITADVSNPVISHDGSFALLRIASVGKMPDLYVSRKDANGKWQKPLPLPSYINSEMDQYYPELTLDNHLYYSSNGDVFYAEYKNGNWQQPRPVVELNTSFSESNIALSRDGKFLVFLSDRTGGYGSYDLFICKKVNGLWSEPTNLGAKINTNIMEYQPRFSVDNSELYFTRSIFKDGKRQGKDVVQKVYIADLLQHL